MYSSTMYQRRASWGSLRVLLKGESTAAAFKQRLTVDCTWYAGNTSRMLLFLIIIAACKQA